ncbi:MAG: VTT domain-containing protein [Sandaracinus sp.]
MDWSIHGLLGLLRDPGPIIVWGGLPALAVIIFLETGALVPFLPGDSLLVVAGLYAGQGSLSILMLNVVLPMCAILGDATSYAIGRALGPRLFTRPKSRFFNPEHLKAAHAFYEKHGGKAIIIARFMPIVRTFVPVVAGAAQMPYARFATFNVVGGFAWVLSMTIIGYYLGGFDIVRMHLEKLIIAVVVISVLPGVIAWWRNRGKRDEKPTAA